MKKTFTMEMEEQKTAGKQPSAPGVAKTAAGFVDTWDPRNIMEKQELKWTARQMICMALRSEVRASPATERLSEPSVHRVSVCNTLYPARRVLREWRDHKRPNRVAKRNTSGAQDEEILHKKQRQDSM